MRIALSIGLLALSTGAFADVVFEQLPTDGGEGGAFSVNEQQLADSFDVSGDVTIRHITWWGSFYGPDPTPGDREFNISVYTSFNGLPFTPTTEAVTASFVSTSIDTASGDTVFRFDADLSGFNLSSGTYFISVVDPQLGSQFRWHNGEGPGSPAYFSGNGTNWNAINDPDREDMAVRLSTVPEPATLASMAIGAAILARRKRAFRQKGKR